MAKSKKIDALRENRIDMEIVVDAYDSVERAMGWYYYLENKLEFPFTAHCIARRAVSPLRVKDEAEVVGMAAHHTSPRFIPIAPREDVGARLRHRRRLRASARIPAGTARPMRLGSGPSNRVFRAARTPLVGQGARSRAAYRSPITHRPAAAHRLWWGLAP